MDEMGLILEQWVSTYEGSKENFAELLENVDASSARARPIEGRHTIWEIVNAHDLGDRQPLHLLGGGRYGRRERFRYAGSG
jgi:hypothetical protein